MIHLIRLIAYIRDKIKKGKIINGHDFMNARIFEQKTKPNKNMVNSKALRPVSMGIS
jgi:hypothetical protein